MTEATIAIAAIEPRLDALPAMETADFAALALWALDQAGLSARSFEELARAIDYEGLLLTEADQVLRVWAYEVSWAAETALDLEGAAQAG